ncbi:MAG: hypothetical protein ACLGSD_13940 [Acidobacteriota bacterium]
MEKSTRQIMAESNQIGVQFLLADLATGITFLNVAEVTQIAATRERNYGSAWTAYRTVLRLLPRVTPTVEQQAELTAKITELKRRLTAAGFETE